METTSRRSFARNEDGEIRSFTADRAARKENPAYSEWEERDSLLSTWILSTISSSLLSRFVRLRHAWQVWEEVHLYCSTQMKTRSKRLRSELRNISKGSRTITEFIARVRTISESLMSIGDPVSHRVGPLMTRILPLNNNLEPILIRISIFLEIHLEIISFSTITLILEGEMDLLEEEASEVALEDVVAVILVEALFNARYVTRLGMMPVSVTSGYLFHPI